MGVNDVEVILLVMTVFIDTVIVDSRDCITGGGYSSAKAGNRSVTRQFGIALRPEGRHDGATDAALRLGGGWQG